MWSLSSRNFNGFWYYFFLLVLKYFNGIYCAVIRVEGCHSKMHTGTPYICLYYNKQTVNTYNNCI